MWDDYSVFQDAMYIGARTDVIFRLRPSAGRGKNDQDRGEAHRQAHEQAGQHGGVDGCDGRVKERDGAETGGEHEGGELGGFREVQRVMHPKRGRGAAWDAPAEDGAPPDAGQDPGPEEGTEGGSHPRSPPSNRPAETDSGDRSRRCIYAKRLH